MREQRHIMRLYSHTYAKPSCVDSAYYAAAPPPPPAIGCESVCQNGFCKSENKAKGRLLQVMH